MKSIILAVGLLAWFVGIIAGIYLFISSGMVVGIVTLVGAFLLGAMYLCVYSILVKQEKTIKNLEILD